MSYTYFKGRQITPYGMANVYGVRRYKSALGRTLTVLGTQKPTFIRSQSRNGRRRNYINFTRDGRTDPVYPRPEVKYFTFTFNNPDPVAQGGEVSCINQLVQGTTGYQRIGAQIALKSVYWQYILTLGNTQQVPCCARVMLLWDRQPNGNVAAPNDILDPAGSPLAIYASMNLANRDRFVVLSDERHTLSPNGDMVKTITGFKKINQVSTYGSVNAVPPNTGALLVFTMSDQASSTSEIQLNGTWRIRWMDS